MLLKKKINKDKLPTIKNSNHDLSSFYKWLLDLNLGLPLDMVTENIAEMVHKLHMSKDLVSNKLSDEKAIVKTKFGLVCGVFKVFFCELFNYCIF